MDNQQAELLQYLYDKFQKKHDEFDQIGFVDEDYIKLKGSTVDDRIEVNKILFQLQNEGYIKCSRLKDLHIRATWITITKKTIEYYNQNN